ncbi:hypothetical protein [Rheinheimera hassiensis]|uniref:H-NS family histone-like protein n=1 Tax=Rheinheimera hassiensis TaxID=1193627 RepID=UPI001F05D374|nr:hypothetical protein [Rheinheimera hassiensis]
MTVKEVFNLAKSLNDSDLQKLIAKLSSLQERRLLKKAAHEKAEQEKAEKAQRAIEHIEQAIKASGLSLTKLGFSSPLSTPDTPNRTSSRKPMHYEPKNQNYAIVDENIVEVLFGRKAGILKREGKAYTFDQLNSKQQQNAVSIVSRLNSK